MNLHGGAPNSMVVEDLVFLGADGNAESFANNRVDLSVPVRVAFGTRFHNASNDLQKV